ncbi:hypothetical protein GJV82_12755 [Cellulosimicrobium sp. BIT-GX5]|uniref:Uncharacterized protein n=1 Tax=Cellulosimicrobium composti TaxID=2672572 RepID=A0A6N7ZKM8_9MICO|nr:hypothetical protein [Cellulosimicrobium composti]MTG89809.1 hypothetical protein [Cellulosimicrobium composti]
MTARTSARESLAASPGAASSSLPASDARAGVPDDRPGVAPAPEERA